MLRFRPEVVRFVVPRAGSVNRDFETTNLYSIDFFLDGHLVLKNQQVPRIQVGSSTAQALAVPGIPGNRNPSKLIIVASTLAPGQNRQELFLETLRNVEWQPPALTPPETGDSTDNTTATQ